MHDKEYLTLDDLGELFGVGESTIRSWERLGKFPAGVRLSRRCVRWRREAVEAFMLGQEKEANS